MGPVITIPNQNEMASALQLCGKLLLENDILSSLGFSALSSAAERLRGRPAHAWHYAIPLADPMLFNERTDRKGRLYTPTIGVEGIGVVQNEEDASLPFNRWDIALTLNYSEEDVHCPRWHFDLANPKQPGPITHLQFGGHKHEGHPQFDTVLKEPRWFTAPHDVILLSEVVAANFFQDVWLESLRNDRRWTNLIHLSQSLCYPAYVSALMTSVGVSGSDSILGGCWNDRSEIKHA